MSDVTGWGIEWYSRTRLDGADRHLMWDAGRLLFFHTREDACRFIHEHYDYIAHRRDLQVEPHGWRVPRAVRVRVTIQVER